MRLKRATFIRIVKILGSMGGAAHGLLFAKSNSELDSPWDSDSKLSMPIGLVRSSTKLWLDKLLPAIYLDSEPLLVEAQRIEEQIREMMALQLNPGAEQATNDASNMYG